MKPKFTENEKRVLQYLIQNGRMPCTEIAGKLEITSQAVGKIIDKLEKLKVIRGYSVDVDYAALGIEIFAIGLFRFKSGEWSRWEEADLRKRMRGPHLIRVYRISDGDHTHIIIYGFRSMRDVENYVQCLQKERGHVSELRKLYLVSAENVIKDSNKDLLLKVIDEMGRDVLAKPEVFKPIPMRDISQTGFFS